MYTFTEQCVQKYTEKVRQYAEWLKTLNIPKGKELSEALKELRDKQAAYDSWQLRLKDMQEILGLTPEKIAEISATCGI